MTHIEAKRLLMRPFVAGDLDLLVRHHGDADVMALIKGGVQTADQARAGLDGYLATWRERSFGLWALFHEDSGAFVGECGLWLGTTISAFACGSPWPNRGADRAWPARP